MPSLLGLGAGSSLSKKSAMMMMTVPEVDNEDKSGEVVDDGDSDVGSSSAGFSNTGKDDQSNSSSSSSFILAAAETLMIKYSKVVLLVVIAMVAATTTAFTYLIVKEQERNEYHMKFHDISNEIMEFSQTRAKNVFNNLEKFGVTLTSYAMDAGYRWPFVVFPDFQVRGILSNEDTGANTLSVNPFVYSKDLEDWNTFSAYSQGWVAEAHAYDKMVHQDLYEMEHHETSYNHNQSVRWNVTGITPYMWEYRADDLYARPRVLPSAAFHAPIWQRAPPCDYASQINMDLRSDPTYASFIDGMLAVNHPVITSAINATYLETNYEYRFDPKEYAEPHSYILEPVYDNFAKNRSMVAFLSAFVRWGTFFTDVLPSTEQGIYVVLESSCGQVFTYKIFGHTPVYLGEGNLHDTRLDDDPLDDIFEFSPDVALGNEHGVHEFCHYYAHMYPSPEWREGFYTSRPYTYAAAVMCCFIVTAIGFIMYDCLVQRRQKKVMKSAARTNAIVTSLFPENVRERLLEGADEDLKKKDQRPDYAGAFLNKRKNVGAALGGATSSETIFGSKPIADLFPETTIMFADLVGFTAWCSTREPCQVFTLLETIYHSFDMAAKRRRVFKVETVGDCYVAVAGLPMPRKDHAIVMAKFATECLQKMIDLVHKLETSLGPDTGDLEMRVGLHSGPVTAGVLRGDKGRFQLFGDTMNTASRMESTGSNGRIQVSEETAEKLIESGRENWVTQREDHVIAKGKGELRTFWLKIQANSCGAGSVASGTSSVVSGGDDNVVASRAARAMDRALSVNPVVESKAKESAIAKLSVKERRLVTWNVEILVTALKQIVARRRSLGNVKEPPRPESKKMMEMHGNVLDEVKDVLALPQFDAATFQNHVDPKTIEISDEVLSQLMDMVARIAGLYQDNPFHSFEHASHVTMSVTKLLSRIVNPIEVSTRGNTSGEIAATLHDHTFGITSDPLTQFACLIAALIHDADHPGVPNSTLVEEQHPLASKYKCKSVAEQNSVDLAWDIIMSEEYKDLQSCIYGSIEEFERFRSIIVNVVMATDIIDKDLGAQRKARWEKAFAQESTSDEVVGSVAVNRKATIVLEHLMQASDVAHTMQHWVVFQKWNERLFQEMYKAFVDGRSEWDPSTGWYQGELGFFDYYIIPLAKKLETCGVFGVSSHEYLSYATANRREWEAKGKQVVKDYVRRFHLAHGDCVKDPAKGGGIIDV